MIVVRDTNGVTTAASFDTQQNFTNPNHTRLLTKGVQRTKAVVNHDAYPAAPAPHHKAKLPEKLFQPNHLLLALFPFTALEIFRGYHFDTNGSNPLQKRPDGLSK